MRCFYCYIGNENIPMSNITEETQTRLIAAAKQVSEHSYSPYSNFAVGAAVLTANGEIYTGTNVENASYGLTICAERFAIGHAISQGNNAITAIAVYAPKADAAPCGACRQFIYEFGADIRVIYFKDKQVVSPHIKELLPEAFSKGDL
jgi:cytidine deaminase